MRVEQEILREARRLIVRHETGGRLLAEEHARRVRRSTARLPAPKVKRPAHWNLDNGFDPYLTRSRSTRIGHSVREALASRIYAPRHPFAFQKAKPDGGERTVCVYQVADSAVSKMLFESILKKNLPLMSSRSYAYRKDISAQNAIQYITSEFKGRNRLYVAEYDFSSYFDSIAHDHIRRVLHDYFLLTEVERQAVEGFLRVGYSLNHYSATDGPIRDVGVPQGTSISLFLANVAAWELDRELEGVGVGFVRYADDTLIWSKDYARVCEAVEVLHSHAQMIGVSVNAAKSPGISLLVPEGATAEIAGKHHVDFLGHRISATDVRMKPASEARIKSHVEQLIFDILLREPLRNTQHKGRLGSSVDRDYVVLIWRLRRYLYGDLTEKALRRYLTRGAPLRRFKGVMSAYPLVNDPDALRALDEWILDRIWLAVRKRRKLLEAAGCQQLPSPHGLDRSSLRHLLVKSSSTGETINLTVPSVRLIGGAISDAASQYGPAAVGRADLNDY